MPIILACPLCQGKLRVSDDLLGGQVRCPACNTTFSAHTNGAASGPEGPPADGEWKDLPLELADPPAEKPQAAPESPGKDLSAAWDRYGLDMPASEPEPEPAAPPPRSEPEPPATPIPPIAPWPNLTLDEPASADSGGAVGAIEITQAAGGPAPPERASPPGRRQEEEGLRECPSCGRYISRDAPRCYHCGERFRGPAEPERESRRPIAYEEEPLRRPRGDRPDRPPRLRRDTIPHRGGLVLGLGIASLALLLMSSGCAAPLTVVLGIVAWVMGQSDLRKIKRNEMDPEGEGLTQGGWICGIIGTVLSGLLVLGCAGFWGIIYVSETNRPRTVRPKFRSPPPQVQPPVQPQPPRPPRPR